MLTWGEKWEIVDSGKCQLLYTPAADIKLKHILSIGWEDLLRPCTTRSVHCKHEHNVNKNGCVHLYVTPNLRTIYTNDQSKISISEPICDKHIAQHMLRSVPVSNAALKKRHSDTLSFTPSCLCLTLNCEKCCSANFEVNKHLKTPGTNSVIPWISMPKTFVRQMPPTQICTSCN